MQNVDLRTRVINNIWPKMKVGQVEKKLFLIFFSIEIFFCLLSQVSKHSMP